MSELMSDSAALEFTIDNQTSRLDVWLSTVNSSAALSLINSDLCLDHFWQVKLLNMTTTRPGKLNSQLPLPPPHVLFGPHSPNSIYHHYHMLNSKVISSQFHKLNVSVHSSLVRAHPKTPVMNVWVNGMLSYVFITFTPFYAGMMNN